MLNPATFKPSLFISIGETAAMFTLRETYLYFNSFEEKYHVQSFHHKNLGQQKTDAMAKALEASRKLTLPLTTTMERLEEKIEMREIHRKTPEEIAEEERQLRIATARRHTTWADENDAKLMSRLTLKGNKWLVGFGKYAVMTFADAIALDRQYFEWLLEQNQEADSQYNNDTQNAMIELFLERAPSGVESTYFGEVGTRYPFLATIKNVAGFEGMYGWTSVYTLVTEEGHELVLFTTSSMGDTGDKLSFNAKVKDHTEYRDVKQTVLQRPTKITEVA